MTAFARSVSVRTLSVLVVLVVFLVAGGAANPNAHDPDVDVEALERRIHERVNAFRTEHGLPPLSWADSLRPLARIHSRDMAERDFFGHVNPSGEDVNDRARRLGLSCTRVLNDSTQTSGFGENLYWATGYHSYRDEFRNGSRVGRTYDWKSEAEMARGTVTGWIESPGHRANLLEARYTTESIGVVVREQKFYVTQIFC